MANPQKAKSARPDRARRQIHGLEDVLGQVRSYLCMESPSPLQDADAINQLVEECRAIHARVPRPPLHPKELHLMDKDGRTLVEADVFEGGRRPSSPELAPLLVAVVADPATWMATPNRQFGGRRPGVLVGTDEESKILDVLHAVDQGLF